MFILCACCKVYGFWEMQSVMNPTLQYHTEVYLPLIHCDSSIHPSFLPQILTTVIYILSTVLPFLKCHINWNHTVCSLFGLASFLSLSIIHLRFTYAFTFLLIHFSYWKTSWWLPDWVNYNYYKQSWRFLCGLKFQTSWVNT